jgi:hypothetical protein
MSRASALLVVGAAAFATMILASGCEYGECYSSSHAAMSDVAPDDLDCKPGDIGYGYGLQGRWAEGCGRVAEYACAGGRRGSCWSCDLIRVQQF